jgi:ankyrin repeat protein
VRAQRFIFIALTALVLPSCSTIIADGTWHHKFKWKATDYFSTPLEVALCNAIEANDLGEMRRLIKQGADVNARGKDNMTPLLWAFPDNKVERFKILLENGADPNVEVESDLNTRRIIIPGDSITHLSARTTFPEQFLLVMKHGGDPNLVHRRIQATPLHAVIESLASDKSERIQLLIDAGADLEHLSLGATPAMHAAGSGQFGIALQLVEAGADYSAYGESQLTRLIHILAASRHKRDLSYERLIAWLEERGESLEEAKKDLERWDSWNGMDPKKAATLRKREIAERLAREAEQKKQDSEERPPQQPR